MSEVLLDREYAEKLDAADPLAGYRERFLLEDPALIYLNGNSLGALPRATLRADGNGVPGGVGHRPGPVLGPLGGPAGPGR